MSPLKSDREAVRALFLDGELFEVYLEAPLAVLMRRDKKGLYESALKGHLVDFAGVDVPYEAPESPEIHIRTDRVCVEECIKIILDRLGVAGGER